MNGFSKLIWNFVVCKMDNLSNETFIAFNHCVLNYLCNHHCVHMCNMHDAMKWCACDVMQ